MTGPTTPPGTGAGQPSPTTAAPGAPGLESPAESPATRASVKSAERVMEVLAVVSREPGQLTMPELARRVGYPRSSLHALVRTLLSGGWLESDPVTGRLRVGAQALVAGSAHLDGERAVPWAQQTLETVRAELGHTAHYARLVGSSVLYLSSRYASTSDAEVLRVGRSLPASVTALGQALLAERTTAEVASLLSDPLPRHTDRSITDREELTHELERVRARGWAVEREQGRQDRVCVAVAVHHRIPATDAISCAMDVGTATEAEIARTAAVLCAERDRLTTTLRREGIR